MKVIIGVILGWLMMAFFGYLLIKNTAAYEKLWEQIEEENFKAKYLNRENVLIVTCLTFSPIFFILALGLFILERRM